MEASLFGGLRSKEYERAFSDTDFLSSYVTLFVSLCCVGLFKVRFGSVRVCANEQIFH